MALVANGISLLGCILMVLSGFIKKKESILWIQCIQFVFLGISHLLLGAISGLVCCAVSIARNIAFAKLPSSFWMKAGFIVLQIVLTFSGGSFAMIELLPILAAVVFTWFLDVPNPVHFKFVLISGQLMWLVYDLYYGNIVAAVFDVLAVLSNLCGIWMLKKK